MNEWQNRRPLSSRTTSWAQTTTRRIASTRITPNQISLGSFLAATAAGLALWATSYTEGWTDTILFLLAAIFCQIRLLCNLFDGMVAIEAGKQEADGPFWNEFPDRPADIAIFVGAGIAVGLPSLGWAAACFAVLTAYTRELAANLEGAHDFSGPMAKQHRMAALTLTLIVAALWNGWQTMADKFGDYPDASIFLLACLVIVVAGSLLTVLGRVRRLLKRLT